MKFSINKIAYNVFNSYSKSEQITYSIVAKFGLAKADVSKRAFFVELDISGEDKENGEKTRSLIVVAKLNYKLDQNSDSSVDENVNEEDNKYFIELLKRLNSTIKDITSQDGIDRPINIDKAIEDHSNNPRR